MTTIEPRRRVPGWAVLLVISLVIGGLGWVIFVSLGR